MSHGKPGPSQPSDAQEISSRANEGERFPIVGVGVGASAGGLEALERFFQRVQPDGGLAYVLSLHETREHERPLAELLAHAPPLPVVIAKDGQSIERDHVYVIPPGTSLVVEGGALRLAAESECTPLPVNAFLTSLAEDQRENAVGIVLSGTGSDGALGIAAVKKHGGSTFAQLPADAHHESMPAAAIATGMVEQVLPAAEIPAALVQLAAERRHRPPKSLLSEEEDVRRALEAVARATGLDFGEYRRSTILRRLQRRMAATGTVTVREYAALLHADADEVRRLAEDLTVNVTSFFRDAEPFRTLERLVIPDVLERSTGEVRIWVPGCSSGEEAYSLAMLFTEQLEKHPSPPKVQIFATDIDASALAEARRGLYGSVVERQASPERLARFFTKRAASYAVRKSLRDLCMFAQHDLVNAPPFSRVDLVSCRNLLIYLEPALQRRVIELLHYALRPGGYLLLGKAETIVARELELFEVVEKVDRVFRRREGGRRRVLPAPGRRPVPLEVAAAGGRFEDPRVKSAADRSRDIVLEEYAPPAVVVDARGEVRYYWGTNLPLYLPPQAGAPVTNLLHLVRRELRAELSAALHNAARQGEPVTYRGVVVEAAGVQHRLNLIARPLPSTEQDQEELALVVFQEVQTAPVAHGTPLDAPTLERYHQLQCDLETTQGRLQATVDELENANEALRLANEQLQATNEELQSSNEELQTSQEEVQSVNEELNTLNAELSGKVDEFELLYGDLQNHFQSTKIATIFLDREGRIARFTPTATALFRFAERDAGRPLSDFTARFDAQDVPEEAARVLETLAPVERTVGLVDEKRSFLMRMHPYLTSSGVVAGVVVSFIDVTQLKETEAALRQAVAERERAEQALRDADRRKDEFLAILSHELRNPLAPIRSSLHVIERAPADAGAARRGQQIIARQVGHLARLVDDLLDATRISRGKLQVDRRSMDLRDLAQRTAEDHRALLAGRGAALEIAVPAEEVWVDGDPTRLAQVIGNLLLNSAKFTASGDLVRLSLEAVGGVAVLRVRDTGAGIEPAMIPRLFHPFMQADPTLNRRLGGLGLGLALVKALVEAHGGEVDVASAGRGMGTEVVLRLPMVSAPARVAVAPAAPTRPRRVLVIDDNVDAAESLRLALEMDGHQVSMAHDGPSGLDRARSLKPEVVLCDIGLPGMDGYAVAKSLRLEPALRDVFIIALTGHALPEDQRLASEAGFDAHLTKPAPIARIQEVIGRAPPRRRVAGAGRGAGRSPKPAHPRPS